MSHKTGGLIVVESQVSYAGGVVTATEYASNTKQAAACPANVSCLPDSGVGIQWFSANQTTGTGLNTTAVMQLGATQVALSQAFGARTTSLGLDGGQVESWEIASTANGPFNSKVSGLRSDTVMVADGGFGANISITQVTTGRSGGAGSATETTNYTYTSATVAGVTVQLVDTESRASVVPSGSGTTMKYQYDGTRISGVVRGGVTREWNGSTYANTTRYVGTFFRTTSSCGGSADPLGRTLQVDGPCLVSSLTATSCSESTYPVTRTAYYGSGSGNNSHRIQSVTRGGPSCSGGLTTSFSNYDARGNATQVTDENGVVTTRTFEADRQTSVTRDTMTWTYTYDAAHLTRIQNPGGESEVICYRASPSLSTGCSMTAAMSNEPTAVFKYGAGSSGGSWFEATLLTYAVDGQVREEAVYQEGNTTTPFLRTTRERNPLGFDTFEKVGAVPTADGGSRTTRGFALDGLLIAQGTPYFDAPDFCGTPGAPSDLCTKFDYWNTGRLKQLTVKPLTGASDMTTCLEYDAHGNVSAVKQGCTTDGVHNYIWDDFGNVIEAKLANVDQTNPIRFQHDARGNVVRKTLPGSSLVHLTWDYDALGRPTEQREGSTVVLKWRYDTAPSVPKYCTAGTSYALGRLVVATDAVWDTWYAYDIHGRVTRESRTPAGGVACQANSLDTNQLLTTTYRDAGVVASVTYPSGRSVHYNYDSTQRVSGINMTTWNGSSWSSPRDIVTSVTWLPRGTLRSYGVKMYESYSSNSEVVTVSYRYGSTSSGHQPTDEVPGNGSPCTSATATDGVGDSTARLRALFVTRPDGDIMRVFYRWKGEHLTEASRCYLSHASPHHEVYLDSRSSPDLDFRYDVAGRMGGANLPNYDSMGGFGYKRVYRYDNRNNRTRMMKYGSEGYDFSYDAGLAWAPDRLTDMLYNNGSTSNPTMGMARDSSGNATIPVKSGRNRHYSYDAQGRVASISGAFGTITPFSTTTPYTGSESVLRSVGTPGGTFSYFYDAQNRRVRKQYPTGEKDTFLWGPSKQLLMETSLRNDDSRIAMDEYLWLGDRPVLSIRSTFTDETAQTRYDDEWAASCPRRNVDGECRPFAIITDVIAKPIATIDSSRRLSGVMEYDPFGLVNRAEHFGEIAPNPESGCHWAAQWMKQGSGPLVRQLRTRVPRYEVSSSCMGQYQSDGGALYESPAGNVVCFTKPSGYVFPWSLPVADGDGVHLMNCSWDGTVNPQPFGISVQGFDYKKYESGATYSIPPLRFPGQYFDPETDFHENWNRYYDPLTGRYLSPEPMLQSPTWVMSEAQSGQQVAAYAYAQHNPALLVDPNGLWAGLGARILAGIASLFGTGAAVAAYSSGSTVAAGAFGAAMGATLGSQPGTPATGPGPSSSPAPRPTPAPSNGPQCGPGGGSGGGCRSSYDACVARAGRPGSSPPSPPYPFGGFGGYGDMCDACFGQCVTDGSWPAGRWTNSGAFASCHENWWP